MHRPSPEDIFHQARELEAGIERDAYLRGACAGDLGLRSKVDALLRADAEAGAFLATASGQDAAHGEAPSGEQVGATIGRYKLLQEIGEGGFGVVFLAEQKEPVKRRVALKVIKLGMDTRQVIARFEAERQALAMMDHHHIAKVLDAGATESGRPYFVMELVKGISITDYCDKNKLTVEERLELFGQVCHAVQHAHQKGIIHRDIKPSNVLVTLHDGVPVPKVIDFGIAKATSAELTERTLFTEFGQMIGTPVYMSPEQAELSGLDIDTRSDIYSLGVLLYELLTGTTPFTLEELRAGGFAEMRRLIREQEPQKPSTRLSTLDTLPQVALQRRVESRKLGVMIRGDLDWIIMRALEKDRTRRYDTANELAADLARFLADEPVHASPPSTSYRMRKFVRRNRKGVIAGVAMAVVLLVFGVREGQLLRAAQEAQLGEEQKAGQLEEANEILATTNETLRKKTEDAERLSYSALFHVAKTELDAGNISGAQRLHALCPERGRNWEWHHLQVGLHQSIQTLVTHEDGAYKVAWSPDGTRLATGGTDGTLRIWNTATGEEVQTLSGHESAITSVAWSPDGTRLATGDCCDGTLRIWDSTGGESPLVLKGHHDSWAESLAWSPDGTRIVLGLDGIILDPYGGTQGLEELANGDRMLGLGRHGNSVAWSPDGTRIAFGLYNRTVSVWDAASRELLWTRSVHEGSVSVAWSPDSTRIVSGGSDETLRVWGAVSGESLLSLSGHGGRVASVAWSPDGTRIVSGSADETLRTWDAGTGQSIHVLKGHGAEGPTSVTWSPDGARIASGAWDGVVHIWEATTGENSQALESGGRVRSVVWSPDGTHVAAAGGDSLLVWAAATGDLVRTLGLEDSASLVAWSPDGTRLYSAEGWDKLCIWDAASGDLLQALVNEDESVTLLAWSPDGKRVVVKLADGSLQVMSASAGERLQVLKGHDADVRSVAWSPDGTRIASGAYGEVGVLRIWDVATGETLHVLEEHRSITSVAWSLDGARIVTGSWDGALRIWDAATGESVLALSGHRMKVSSVSWSPNGTRIVSGSSDGSLRLWDVAGGDSLQTLSGHAGAVSSVAWSPDGTRIVSGSEDGTLRIWESRLEDAVPMWRAADCRRRARMLVDSLFKEHLFLERILSALKADATFSDELRETALRLAMRLIPRVSQLSGRAWDLVNPDRADMQTDVAFGLRLARAIVDLSPEDYTDRDTLAWALFANGLYDEALAESERALELAGGGGRGFYAEDPHSGTRWEMTREEGKELYRECLDRLRAKVAKLRKPAVEDVETNINAVDDD